MQGTAGAAAGARHENEGIQYTPEVGGLGNQAPSCTSLSLMHLRLLT
jgi:hypothetical protein